MLKRTRKHRKKLARLVLAALLFSGGAYGLMSPSVAAAADPVTVTGYTNSGGFTPSGSMTWVPVGSGSSYYNGYPADESVTVLNIEPGESDTWTGGNSVSVYGHYTAGVSASASGYTVNMTGTKAQVNNLYGSYNFEYYYARNIDAVVTVSADENEVTVSEGASVKENVAGGYNSTEAYAYGEYYVVVSANLGVTASADTNTVTIEGSAVGGNVYGGNNRFSGYSYAYHSDSTVNIEATAGADNNTVTINGAATVGKNVYGGYSSLSTVNYSSTYGDTKHTAIMSANINEVTISDDASVGVFVYGGYASGYVEYGTTGIISTVADNNTVTIKGAATIGKGVSGGDAYANSYAYDYAALAHTAEETANANKNEVTISGEAVVGTEGAYEVRIYGGQAYAVSYAYAYEYNTDATATATANANINEVTITDNTIVGSGNSSYDARIFGGLAYASAVANYSYNGVTTATGNANENTVIISEKADGGDYVYGGSASASGSSGIILDTATADANKNKVTVSGEAAVGQRVYGGSASASASGSSGATINATANADENKVTVSEQAAVKSGYIYGGYASASGSSGIDINATANANKNEVTISDQAAADGYVYGGAASAEVSVTYSMTNTAKGTADASNNTVTISGITGSDATAAVKYNVVGGYASGTAYANVSKEGSAVTSNSTVDVTSNENRVDISGNASVGFGYGALIIGGFNDTRIQAYAYFSDNTAIAGGTANANNNTVTIRDAVVGSASNTNDAVSGGYNKTQVQAHAYNAGTEATAEGTANANENEVTISGASDVESDVYGGRNEGGVDAYYGYAITVGLTANANKNEVTISSDAGAKGTVYGGYNNLGTNNIYATYGTTTAGLTADANENTVIIDGAVGGAVYGGRNATNVAYVYTYYSESKANLEATASADDNEITISGAVEGAVYGGHNTTDFNQGYAYYEGSELTAGLTASADNNEITIDGAVGGAVYGGFNETNAKRVYAAATGSTATLELTASTSNNSVTFNNGATAGKAVYGGNSNIFTDATYDSYFISIYGNLTNSLNAAAIKNEVTISGASVGQHVYGGEANAFAYYGTTNIAEGTASENEIIISSNAVMDSKTRDYTAVYGGIAYASSSSGDQKNTTATATATVNANKNKATVSDAVIGTASTYYAEIYGGAADASAYANYGTTSTANATANANENEVTISDTAVGTQYYATIYGGKAYDYAYANYGTTNTAAQGTASANNNTVTISDVVVDPSYYMTIYGGAATAGVGAYVSEAPTEGLTANAVASANYNTVAISGDAVIGSAAEYYVQIIGGSASGNAYIYVNDRLTDGAELTASANNNTVTISGGTVGSSDNAKNSFIIGGYSNVEASSNTVTIEGDTTKVYTGAVIGGYSVFTANNTVNSKAISNAVTINAEGAEVGAVYGGRTVKGDVSENQVTISAGSVTGIVNSSGYYYAIADVAAVAGGYTQQGDATSNTVELSDITVSIPEEDSSAASSSAGSSKKITMGVVGGYAGNGDATDNTVKLQNTTIKGGVYGGATASPGSTGGSSSSSTGASSGGTGDVVTGNTLVIGGINTVDGEVTNFETIKLADTVEWSSGTTVLKADQFTDNADGTRSSLDITDAETNLATATSGSMALLASDTEDDFKTLSLVYSGGTAALSETNKIKVMKSYDATTETTPTNGVTLTYASSQVVSLDKDNDYKNVLYKIQNITSNVSLGDMTWENGRDLAGDFTFADTVVVDATNLTFADTTTLLKKDDSTVLVANATGITSSVTPTAGTGKTIGVNYNDSKTGIAYEATASGNVTAVTDALQYIISSVTTDKITLGSQAWGTTADMPDASWTASASTQIDDTAFAYTGEATTALKANDTATILNAKGLTTASPVTAGTDKAVGINYTDNAGVNYVATATGHVAAAADAVNYVVDSVAVTGGVNLQNWNGKDTSVLTTGWTGTGVAVDTGTFAAPTDMKLGETRTVATAVTGFFGEVSGSNAHPQNGGAFNEDTGGVKLAGSMIGGVKAEDDGTTARLTYYAMKKTADTMTLGEVTFANGGTARKFGSEYDLTGAAINADGLSFTADSLGKMETGNTMTIVDASGAFKSGGAALTAFKDKTYEQSFTETPEKHLSFTGTHTDTLSQDAAQTKLTYSVGTKNVTSATISGDIAWDETKPMYKNEKYTFSGTAAITFDKGASFTSTNDPLNRTMTLISGNVDGMVTAVPEAIALSLENTNTTLEATVSGSAAISGGDLTFTVNDAALNTVIVKGTGSTADTVSSGWTLAAGATVETDGMTVPEVETGKQADIITADTEGFFDAATINGKNKYKAYGFSEEESGITFAGSQEKGVKADGKSLVYAVGTKDVNTATMTGEIAWKSGGTYYNNTKYKFTADSEIDVSGVKFTADADPLNQSMTLISNADGKVKDGSPEFTVKLSNTVLKTTAAGEAADAAGNLDYKVTSVTLDKVTVNEAGIDAIPEGWTVNTAGVGVDTDSMTVPTDVAAGEEKPILSGGPADTFKDEDISGANAYKETEFTDASNPDDTSRGVSITGAQGKGVKASDNGTSLVYKVSKKEVSEVNAGTADWQPGATLLDASGAEYDYSKVAEIGMDSFGVTFDKPEEVAAGESMTLLKANATLADMAVQEKISKYSFEPVSGVTVDAGITASLEVKDGIVTYTPSENNASKLTFGDVLWNADAPMLTRPKNITFAGADVDTSAINFTNVIYLDANQQMTLVSGFGDSVGTITGGKYMVGTAFIGEGEASLSGSDLIFTTTTEAGLSEQTHKTVMAMDAGLAMLMTGNEFMGKAMDGLADVRNRGKDGVSTFASVGGGASRYNTGSHVNTHTWNAIVGVGKTNETKKGTMEYGIFGEYGKGSYKVYSNAGNGDGDAHYAGGGVLAKWTNSHDVYTEASFRAGRLSDSSSDIMQDSLGNKYGYNVHASYYGAHIGAGKITNYKGGKSLDVYGKFFYLKRDGVEYDAVQHYSLDSVSSSVLRIGGRYGTTGRKWNWYGGLAYEYEFDGDATGTVKGKAIRAASIQGSSIRGEFGMRMDATKTNPWQTDISLYGYAGKHRGFGGNVSVMYMF